MTAITTGKETIFTLNRNNGLETLTSLLSLEDRGKLRASCKTLKSEIPDIPEEAKAFLVFESKIPLIETIIRKTRAYRDQTLMQRGLTVEMRTYMSQPFYIISAVGAPALSLLIGGDSVEKLIVYSIPLVLSIAFIGGASLIGRCRTEIKQSELRQLWQEYGNQPAHQDLFIRGLRLRDQLRQHRIQNGYTAAGGMDRYFLTQGLDSALAEMQVHR
ncbi:MAG: hypothetical protein NTX49_08740 [Chlamydiae bacterium]|nr:hypothetical protein [Chlamydiota bacterium]